MLYYFLPFQILQGLVAEAQQLVEVLVDVGLVPLQLVPRLEVALALLPSSFLSYLSFLSSLLSLVLQVQLSFSLLVSLYKI